MKTKILISLSVIGAIAAIVIGGTIAYFSDTETSSGNTFSAGTLDLKVNDKEGSTVDKITITNAKPGDSGSYTWTAKNVGTVAGKLSLVVSGITNDDNGCTEPETTAGDNSCGPTGGGELGQYIDVILKVAGNPIATTTLNLLPKTYSDVANLGPSETVDVTLEWSIANTVGNIIQSDSASFDITFNLVQS